MLEYYKIHDKHIFIGYGRIGKITHIGLIRERV